ncbi:MAG: hypothetical protein DYG94_11975 [Leptolyngbya sp. PLA3]|nr:MAG: hypothetical protein EDM82_05475 [Cyanobacteria bacterium CYA]MCE7969443.1 hypothetical protein [Leptolyngbya sp. PL-A3]
MLEQLRHSPRAGSIALVLASGVLLGPMLVEFIGGALSALSHGAPPWPGLSIVIRTLAVSLLIGAAATGMGWFPARVLASRRAGRLGALCLVPLLMPPYLAYSGYSILRDPSWITGDWLESLSTRGHAWVTISTGRALAILGLALWAWPLSAFVLAAGMRGQGADDALRLDAPPLRRVWERLLMHRAGIAGGVLVVALTAIGSAVPLHLAQIDTVSIDLWRRMSESSPGRWGAVWLAGWPIVAAAVAGAMVTPRLVRRLAMDTPVESDSVCPSRRTRVAAWAAWLAATVFPLTLFILTIQSPRSLVEFWKLSGAGLWNGLRTAVGVAVVSGLLGLGVSYVIDMSRRPRTGLIGVVIGAWVFTAVIPGVFIGAALSRLGTSLPRGWADVLLIDAHLARFACVPMLVGAISALSESPELCDLRQIEGTSGWGVWVRACLQRRVPVLAAALAAGIMGLHEIEATTMLLPPGRDNLAQQILGYLHFSRMEEMSAAAVYLIGGGLLAGAGVSALLWRSWRRS